MTAPGSALLASAGGDRAASVERGLAALEAREQEIVAASRNGTTTVEIYRLEELP